MGNFAPGEKRARIPYLCDMSILAWNLQKCCIEKRAGLSCTADTAVTTPLVITAAKAAHSQDIQLGRKAVHGGTAGPKSSSQLKIVIPYSTAIFGSVVTCVHLRNPKKERGAFNAEKRIPPFHKEVSHAIWNHEPAMSGPLHARDLFFW